MPDDVFQHDDGVVDDETDGERQRQQRDIIDRIAEHIHEGEGADDRHRQRQRRDERRRHRLQEHENDHHDQRDRQRQRELHVVNRLADRDGAVVEHARLDAWRQLRFVSRQTRADVVDDLHRIGVGLAIDGKDDRAVEAEPRRDLIVLDGVDDAGDLVELHRRPVAPGDDERRESLGLLHLARGFERHVLPLALQRADRRIGVGGSDRLTDLRHRQAARRRLVGIDLHAHGEFLLTENLHLRDAGDLRNLLRENLLGVIVGRRERQRRRGQRDEQDRNVGRIDLAEARRRGQVGRQFAQRRRNLRLHVERCAVDVPVEIELQDDVGEAAARLRRHRRDRRNRREHALERRGDGRGHGFRAGTGQIRRHRDGREVDAGQGGDRQLSIAEHAKDQKRQHQQRRHHRSTDAELRQRHQLASFFGSPRTSTLAPSVNRLAPSTTSVSTPLSPSRMTTRPS
jgi:hypothetical protein